MVLALYVTTKQHRDEIANDDYDDDNVLSGSTSLRSSAAFVSLCEIPRGIPHCSVQQFYDDVLLSWKVWQRLS